MANLSIVKDGRPIGAITEEGFFSKDEDLTKTLQRIFDGEGAMVMSGGEDENGFYDVLTPVKPGEDGFMEAFREDMARSGYVLARGLPGEDAGEG